MFGNSRAWFAHTEPRSPEREPPPFPRSHPRSGERGSGALRFAGNLLFRSGPAGFPQITLEGALFHLFRVASTSVPSGVFTRSEESPCNKTSLVADECGSSTTPLVAAKRFLESSLNKSVGISLFLS